MGGGRTHRAMGITFYRPLGALPEPKLTNGFCQGGLLFPDITRALYLGATDLGLKELRVQVTHEESH